MRRVLAIGLLIIGTISPRVGGTTAYLTGTVTTGSKAFASAQVDLDALDSGGAAKAQLLMSYSSVYPGLTTYDSVIVKNTNTAGNAEFLFGASSDVVAESGRDLATAIQLTVIKVDAAADCNSTDFATLAAVGARQIYGGTTGAQMVSPTSATAINIIGDTVSGAASGSKITLPPTDAQQILCFRVQLPTSTSFALHGGDTPRNATVQFSFTAVQASGLA